MASNLEFWASARLPAKSLFLRNYCLGKSTQKLTCLALPRRSSIVNRFSRIHKRGSVGSRQVNRYPILDLVLAWSLWETTSPEALCPLQNRMALPPCGKPLARG
jgi:hypothetical protein